MAGIAVLPQATEGVSSSQVTPDVQPDLEQAHAAPADATSGITALEQPAQRNPPTQVSADVEAIQAPSDSFGDTAAVSVIVEDIPATASSDAGTSHPEGRGESEASSRSSAFARSRCFQALVRIVSAIMRPPDSIRVEYTPRFRAMATLVVGISLAWVCNYFYTVLPTIEEHGHSECKYMDNQLTYNARMLFIYFCWFVVSRLLLFVPCIAIRVAQVQSRTHGFCRTYLVHLLLRDGPLYIFVVGSLLFWFHLMQSPNCEQGSPELYGTLKGYSIFSCMVSISCIVFAYWHNKLLSEMTGRDIWWDYPTEDQSAPPDTLEKMETCTYDPAVFGDEDGKQYPAECPICLLTWEPEDVIKVTPCKHAFHEECLGNWLKTARTCALCRLDFTKEPSDGASAAADAQTLGASSNLVVAQSGAGAPPAMDAAHPSVALPSASSNAPLSSSASRQPEEEGSTVTV